MSVFDDRRWDSVTVVVAPGGVMRPATHPPILISKNLPSLQSQNIKQILSSYTFTVDFAHNTAALIRLQLPSLLHVCNISITTHEQLAAGRVLTLRAKISTFPLPRHSSDEVQLLRVPVPEADSVWVLAWPVPPGIYPYADSGVKELKNWKYHIPWRWCRTSDWPRFSPWPWTQVSATWTVYRLIVRHGSVEVT